MKIPLLTHDKSKPNFPREKLSLLGLDPDDNITLEKLHDAYIAKLKYCHPDRQQMNPDDAHAMTNSCYTRLSCVEKKNT